MPKDRRVNEDCSANGSLNNDDRKTEIDRNRLELLGILRILDGKNNHWNRFEKFKKQ